MYNEIRKDGSAHQCNKDIVLLTYPPQYKCSICGAIYNQNFIKIVGESNITNALTPTDITKDKQ